MLTSVECWTRYGDPVTEKHLVVWHVPEELHVGVVPAKIYCNRDLVEPLEAALRNLVERGLVAQLYTWDGCFNIRPMRQNSKLLSLHSWAVAVDVNRLTNMMGHKPTLSPEFVKCFTDAGLEWGGTWSTPDGMHFQLRGHK